MANKLSIAVLFGGQSSEHNISRISAQYVLKNLDEEKYDIIKIGITKKGQWFNYNGPIEKISDGAWEEYVMEDMNLVDNLSEPENINIINRIISNGLDKKIDVVFPVLHGINGEDGTIQGLLELAQIPYVGCNVISSAIGMDKCMAKIILAAAKIPQADYLSTDKTEINNDITGLLRKIENKFKYPIFIKPSNAGSSVGVNKVYNKEELQKALNEAIIFDRKVLIEEFVKGKEIECAILGNDEPQASVVGEIIPANDFYDFEAKYSNIESKTLIPANISDEITKKIRNYALEAFKALDCSGLSRVDFFLRDNGEIVLNEINTLPGFTSISMYAKLWEASGICYQDLLEKLINLSIERYDHCQRKI